MHNPESVNNVPTGRNKPTNHHSSSGDRWSDANLHHIEVENPLLRNVNEANSPEPSSTKAIITGDPKDFFINIKKKWKLLCIAILGVIVIIIGISLICSYIQVTGSELAIDYTYCKTSEETCADVLRRNPGTPCVCYKTITLTEPMEANVTLYYELESYNWPGMVQSRDDEQLSGHLSPKLAESCRGFAYDKIGTGDEPPRPIAPCGALADAMFTDSFKVTRNSSYITSGKLYGMLPEEEKARYRNPPGDLVEAFKNFTKPTSWKKPVYELDEKYPENNGFQNEAFIAWMNTDLRRKPAVAINHTGIYKDGLPVGNYTLRIEYAYSPFRYAGKRQVILSNKVIYTNETSRGFGVALIVIGVIMVVGNIIYIIKPILTYTK